MTSSQKSWLQFAILTLCAIGALVAMLLIIKVSPLEAAATIWKSSFGSSAAISGTLKEMTPLIVAGLAVFIALRAGLFNIGVEGQFLMGAMVCMTVAVNIGGIFGIILGLLSGMAAGALWAYPAGWIKAWRGGHEVITTILLNNIAGLVAQYLLTGPLKDKGQESLTTVSLPDTTMLPKIINNGPIQVSLAIVLGIAVIIAFGIWLKRTVGGYELRAVGANPSVASFAGINAKKVMVKAMSSSGAIAGLAGAMHVLAFEGRFYDRFSSGYGFDALGVAMLAGGHPLALIPSALLFGSLNKSSTQLQLLHIPKGLTWIIAGLVIIVFAALRYRKEPKID